MLFLNRESKNKIVFCLVIINQSCSSKRLFAIKIVAIGQNNCLFNKRWDSPCSHINNLLERFLEDAFSLSVLPPICRLSRKRRMLANTMKNCGAKKCAWSWRGATQSTEAQAKNFSYETDKRRQKHLTIFMWKMNDPFMALAVDQGCYLPS